MCHAPLLARRASRPLSHCAGLAPDQPQRAGAVTSLAELSAFLIRSDQPWCVRYGSAGITLRLSCRADANCDGLTNSTDISAFIQRWIDSITDATLDADFNGDEIVDSADLSAFLASWLGVLGDGGNC